jgi:TPR repeat protein
MKISQKLFCTFSIASSLMYSATALAQTSIPQMVYTPPTATTAAGVGQSRGLEIDFDAMLREYPEKITQFTADVLESQKSEALRKRDDKKMFTLGVMYRDGLNVQKDYLQAREWFQKAANLDNTDALVALARIQMLAQEITGFPTSFDEARKYLEEAVAAGNPKAYFSIGELYETGNGYLQSSQKALENFKLSAEKAGDVNAFVKIANYNYYQIGVPQDKRATIEALVEVRKRTIDRAVANFATKILGQIFFQVATEQTDDRNRFQLFELAWEYKNPLAADALGDLYQKGIGTDRDYKKAIEWYEKSISMESIYGMEKLGYIYITGPEDIDRDYNKARRLFIRGAELGGVNAAYYLGYMYHNGMGVEKDLKEAQKWFDRAQILADRAKRKQMNDEAVYQTFGAGFRDPLKETVENNEKVAASSDPLLDPPAPVAPNGSTIQTTPVLNGEFDINTDAVDAILNGEGSGAAPAPVQPQPQQPASVESSKPASQLEQDPSVPALPTF